MRQVTFSTEFWEMKIPFRITGYTFTGAHLLHVTISADGISGHGEATGVYYMGETGESMLAQAQSVKSALEQGAGREEMRRLLPAGGARNAIDCALWDLEAKRAGKSIWQLTGIKPGSTISVNTIGIGTPAEMAQAAKSLDTPKIKVKLDGEFPLERISAVRAARPDAEIVVDCNQGWTFEQLVELAPKFKALGVAMIEQPLPRGGDEELEGYDSPIPLCADESCLNTSEFEQAARRYQMINIKLDKTGGLTEALALARDAQSKGLRIMVGCMLATSLAMAPAMLVAQYADVVDLDGPLLLKQDRNPGIRFEGSLMYPAPSSLWG
jgi:L-Ala-D/L-Glu epimerase